MPSVRRETCHYFCSGFILEAVFIVLFLRERLTQVARRKGDKNFIVLWNGLPNFFFFHFYKISMRHLSVKGTVLGYLFSYSEPHSQHVVNSYFQQRTWIN